LINCCIFKNSIWRLNQNGEGFLFFFCKSCQLAAAILIFGIL
jgi:hypothetical protein